MSWNRTKPIALESMTAVLVIVALVTDLGSCSDVIIDGNSGSFVSPNYPSNYDHNIQQVYRARLSTPGPQQVQLDYVVDIEGIEEKGAATCQDRLSIPAAPLELCGSSANTTYMTIEGSEFNMTFSTDSSIAYSGFNVTFTVLQGNCRTTMELWAQEESYEYRLVPITDILTRRSLVLTARCCSSFKATLSHTPDSLAEDRKQILIAGYDRPVETRLRACSLESSSCLKVTALNSSADPNTTVHCCAFRSFWFQWNLTTLAVGSGTKVGSDLILQHTVPFEMHVRYVYLLARIQLPLVIALDAPLPDSYCQHPSPISPLPDSCPQPESTSGVVTTALTVFTSTPVPESSPFPADDRSTVDYSDVTVTASNDVRTYSFDDVSGNNSVGSVGPEVTTDAVSMSSGNSADVTVTDTVQAMDSTTSLVEVHSTGYGTETNEATILASRVENTTTAITTATREIPTSNVQGDIATVTKTTPEVITKDTAVFLRLGTFCTQAHCACNCIQLNTSDSLENNQAPSEKEQERSAEDALVRITNTSARARRYVSAEDERASSMYLSVLVGTVCILPLVAIIASDCWKLFFTVYSAVRTKVTTTSQSS